jgi:hypothetical protein
MRDGCCVQGTDKINATYHSIDEAKVDEIDETRGTYGGEEEGEMANWYKTLKHPAIRRSNKIFTR